MRGPKTVSQGKWSIMATYTHYHNNLMARFWDYRKQCFAGREDLFDMKHDGRRSPQGVYKSPPVFLKESGDENVLLTPLLSNDQRREVLGDPSHHRHYRFPSMSSSQALTASVFGNLKALNKLNLLTGIRDAETGLPVFTDPAGKMPQPCLVEQTIKNLLDERTPTNLDVMFGDEGLTAGYRIVVECKLTEQKVGQCSKGIKRGRNSPCRDGVIRRDHSVWLCPLTPLTRNCIPPYWTYVPEIFGWSPDIPRGECPLLQPYQLIRNVLAACIFGKDCERHVELGRGHAVLIYDARNPEFAPRTDSRSGDRPGRGWNAYREVKDSLVAVGNDVLLRRCSWQQIVGAMAVDPALTWLVVALNRKYGL